MTIDFLWIAMLLEQIHQTVSPLSFRIPSLIARVQLRLLLCLIERKKRAKNICDS